MTAIRLLGPAFAILTVTLLCALPWGAAGDLRLVQPLLPYVVIHLNAERRGALVPDWLVFLAGFATDVVGQGPLGYWALIYLCGYTMVRSMTSERRLPALMSIGFCAFTLTCLALMQWSVASIYYVRPVEALPLALAAGITWLVYVGLVALFPGKEHEPARSNSQLQRGI